MRVFKWIVSFATWKYDVTAGALDGSGFEMDQLYYGKIPVILLVLLANIYFVGALGHTAHEDLARETELYDVHKAPLKRLKTISTSAGASFGLPGQSVAEQMKSRTGPVVSDATRRRICKRTGGSTSELPSSAPAYIPFSQRSSKTDVAASAALKFIKKKGQVVCVSRCGPDSALTFFAFVQSLMLKMMTINLRKSLPERKRGEQKRP